MEHPRLALRELHLHLEGAIQPETLREIDPVADPRGDRARRLRTPISRALSRSYVWVNRKLRSPGDYAARGAAVVRIPGSAGRQLRGSDPFGGRESCGSSRIWARSSTRWRAKPDDRRIGVRWILDATRQWGADAAKPVFDFAAERMVRAWSPSAWAGSRRRVRRAGSAILYAQARDRGLRLTCHAGETTGPESVWDALEIGAERIGHGIRAIEDPRLVEHLRDQRIPLEVCITSNVRTGAVASLKEHPVRKLFDAGCRYLEYRRSGAVRVHAPERVRAGCARVRVHRR